MGKRKKKFGNKLNEGLVLEDVQEVIEAEEIGDGDDSDENSEFYLSDNDSDRDEDDETDYDMDTSNDEDESDNVLDNMDEELEIDFPDEIDLELSEEELDVDVDSDDSTEEVEQEAKDPKLTEVEHEELEEVTFDPADLVAAVSKVVNRIPDAGVMSVINSVKNGKRVSISREIMNKIGQLDSVQMGFMKNGIVIGQYLSDTNTSYQLRTQGAKKLIYSKGLVEQITDYFGIDFSNRTSITFHEATYQKLDGNIVAVIGVK